MKKIAKVSLLSMLLIALISLLVVPALAQYGGTGTLTGSSTSGSAGGTITVSGSGFEPGVEVKIYFDDSYIASATADSSGNFSKTITIPSDASAGTHTVKAVGGERTLTMTYTVTGAAAGFAYTGAKILFWLLAGAAIISLGLAVVKSDSIRARASRGDSK